GVILRRPRNALALAVVLCLSAATARGDESSSSSTASGRWVASYYPAYGTGKMPISEIPFSSVTHVIHFALVPRSDGSLSDPDGLKGQTSSLVSAAHAAGVRALLGVGGDTGSGATAGFRGAASPARRSGFVAKIVSAMAAGGYDGVDLNWESIRFPQDVASFR